MLQTAIKLSSFTIVVLLSLLFILLWDKYHIEDINTYKMTHEVKQLSSKEKELLGSWVEPISGKSDYQGFTLCADGTAKSINTGELFYKKWKIQGNKLTLEVETYDKGLTSEDIETYIIAEVLDDALLLKIGESIYTYKRV